MVTPLKYVEAPAVERLPFGLLSAAVVIDDPDPHAGFGVEWEPEFCGPARRTIAACLNGPDLGDAAVSVDNTGQATVSADNAPTDQTYTVTWGDDATGGGSATTYNGAGFTHGYADPGDYIVEVRGSNGYRASFAVTVVDATASGPFDGVVDAVKVAEDGIGIVTSSPFVVYHLSTCRLVGREDAEARARRALELGEGRAVEQAFADLFTTAALDPDPDVDALAVDVTPTPGTAVDVVTGLGLLEQYAGQNYGGVPTFHMTRNLATNLIARGSLEPVGDLLRTKLRSKVAAGAGYEGVEPVEGVTAGDGEAWLIVTGTVVVRRSPTIETGEVPTLAAPTNEFSVLAERPESIGFECFAAAVLVETEAVV